MVVIFVPVIEPKLQFLAGVTLGVVNEIILKLSFNYHVDGRFVQRPSLPLDFLSALARLENLMPCVALAKQGGCKHTYPFSLRTPLALQIIPLSNQSSFDIIRTVIEAVGFTLDFPAT